MTTCPDRGRLAQLLSSSLVYTELDELEQHVEGCSVCQRTLEELTDDTNWGLDQELGALITVDGGEPGLVVDAIGLTAEGMAAVDERGARPAHSLWL